MWLARRIGRNSNEISCHGYCNSPTKQVIKSGAGHLHGHQRSCAHCSRLILVYTLLSNGWSMTQYQLHSLMKVVMLYKHCEPSDSSLCKRWYPVPQMGRCSWKRLSAASTINFTPGTSTHCVGGTTQLSHGWTLGCHRKCEADSIGQDNIKMSKIGVEPVTAVPPKRCYQDLVVPPCSFTNQEFHFNKWPWTFLDHFQRQKEAIGMS